MKLLSVCIIFILIYPLAFAQVKDSTIMLDSIFVHTHINNRYHSKPIEIIPLSTLQQTGQTKLDKMLQYSVPAYNTRMNITIADPTIGFDPSGLRGLGSSRSLVLINGKRKSLSSLVFTTTHGSGEVGFDLSTLPANMIQSVQVLSENASAVYGSDAMAGVINIVLNKNVGQQIALNSGITAKGDGAHIGYDYTGGFQFLKKGFVLIGHSLDIQQRTNRAGQRLLQDTYFGILQNTEKYTQYESFFKKHPDLGQIYGQPNSIHTNIGYNLEYEFNQYAALYSFGSFDYHISQTYGLYRPPYFRSTDYGLLHKENTPYEGYGPQITQQLFNYDAYIGLRGGDKNLLYYDVSLSYSGNPIQNKIYNTINTSMQEQSPTSFNTGGFNFSQTILNLDLSKSIKEKVFLQLGGQFRYEWYKINAGDSNSFRGTGADGLPGIQNTTLNTRYNLGAYAQVGWLVFKPWYVEGAVRVESYQHIPYNVSWNLNTSYSLWKDKLKLRASVSTGFRAPALQQSALSIQQSISLSGKLMNAAIINNADAMQYFSVPLLKNETSFNYSAGFQLTPIPNLSIEATYFNTTIYNRILFSEYMDSIKNNTPQILSTMRMLGVGGVKFFINGATTNTQGVEWNIAYRNIRLAQYHSLDIQFAGALRWNQLIGNLQTPDNLALQGVALFNRKTISYLFESQPNQKAMLGITYHYQRFSTTLSNTYFGAVYYRDLLNTELDQKFKGKVITDISLGYQLKAHWKFDLYVNNLFNIYPDKIHQNITSLNFGGRLPYTWEQNQFGFLGTTFGVKVGYVF